MTKSKVKFNPPKIQCDNCKDIIYSSYPGEFVTCSCYASSSRIVSIIFEYEARTRPELYEEEFEGRKMESAEGHKLRCQLQDKYGEGIFIDSTHHYGRYGGKSGITVIDPGEEADE